jgi:hypothetical protein
MTAIVRPMIQSIGASSAIHADRVGYNLIAATVLDGAS